MDEIARAFTKDHRGKHHHPYSLDARNEDRILSSPAVTGTHIADWINDADKERGQGSRKVALGHIHTFFVFCCANGWVAADPSQAIGIDYSVLSHDQKEPAQRQPFTPDELERLTAYLKSELLDIEQDVTRVEQASEYTVSGKEAKLAKLGRKHAELFFWLFAVRCSAQTGLRLSDVAGLEWRCFAEAGKIVVWMDKTNRRIEHQLPAELERMVTQIPMASQTHLFPEQHKVICDVRRRSLLGDCYNGGYGVTKDLAESAKWYRKAAEQNDIPAERMLGDYYAAGGGVPQDYQQAINWYKKAANQGDDLAQAFLAEFYLTTMNDATNAVYWFQRGANQNDAYSQDHLGQLFRDGRFREK